MRTLIKRTLILLLCIYGVYFVPVNLFLLLHLPHFLASEGKGKSFNVNYDVALSVIPGKVHLWHLYLDGTDDNVHWMVDLSGVTFAPDFTMLLQRELFIHSLSTSSATVHIRQHREEEKAAAHAKLHEGEKIDPHPDPQSKPWKITVNNIRIDQLKSAQLSLMKFEGDSMIEGSFMLFPGRVLEIARSHWEIKNGKLEKERDLDSTDHAIPLLGEMHGDTKVDIHPADLTRTQGNEIFKTMDIHQELDANVYSSNLFEILVKPYPVSIHGETLGTMKTRLNIEFGTFMANSLIDANFKKIHVRSDEDEIEAMGDLKWDVLPKAPKNRGELSLALKQLKWIRGGEEIAKADSLSLRGQTTDLSIYENLFNDISLNLSCQSIQTAGIGRILRKLLADSSESKVPEWNTQSVTSQITSAKIEANWIPALKSMNAQVEVATPEMSVSYNQGVTRLKTEVVASGKISSSDYEKGRFKIEDLKTKLSNIHIIHQDREDFSSKDWNLDFTTRESVLETRPFSLHSKFSIAMKNMKVPARYFMPDQFAIKAGLFFFPMSNFSGGGEVKFDAHLLEVNSFHAISSSGKIFGEFAKNKDKDQLAMKALIQLGSVSNICVSQLENEKSPSTTMGNFPGRCEGLQKLK